MNSRTQHHKTNSASASSVTSELDISIASDPILVKRALISNWAKRASRLGYSLFGVSIVAVVWGLTIEFTPSASRVASAGLIVGSIVLAPAILVQYSVKAAVRDERERGL
jgi:hypothetical protein